MTAAAILVALAAALQAGAAAQPPSGRAQRAPAPAAGSTAGSRAVPAQLGVTVAPDTVTVGQPFVVTVRVRAPRGATIEFPLAPDSASQVELIDPRQLRRAPDTTAAEVTAVYRAAAWDVGARSLGLGDAVVRFGAAERRVPLAGARVFVRSVLPADTAAPREPKPPRSIFEAEVPWWRRWLPYIVAAVVGALLLAWLWRRLRRARPIAPADAFAEADAGFARIEQLRLLEAGERGRYVALVVEVLRDYLARRVPEARLSLTSRELVDAVAASPLVPVARLAPLLAEADLVKFARLVVATDRARALGAEARAIVRETEDAVMRAEQERAEAERLARQPLQVTTKRPSEPPQRAA